MGLNAEAVSFLLAHDVLSGRVDFRHQSDGIAVRSYVDQPPVLLDGRDEALQVTERVHSGSPMPG